ncbi:RNA polymerase I-specific transcription initiation factor RRN3, partial [Lecanoromycetidae sp. Uapishka_2]
MNGWEKAPQLIQEEVRRAFAKRASGDSSGYDKLKEIYAVKRDEEDELSPNTMKNYTMALLGNVSALNKSNSDFVHMVLNSEWLGRQEEYVVLYARLLANLTSAHGIFLGDTMRMLVDNLTAVPPSNGRLPNLPAVCRSTIYARALKAIHYLLQLLPAAGRLLSISLVNAFPHETDSRRTHVIFVQNLLKLVAYAPQLRGEVLALITERLVKIDVQVQVDMEDLAEDVGEGLVERIPQVRPDLMNDDVDSETSDDDSDTDDEEGDADAQRTKAITKNVEKMDALLDILFSNYNQVFMEGSEAEREGTLDILLSQFVTTILPTHRSRHTQFLIFHFAQHSPTYIDTFVGTCVQITFDRNQPAIVRQASAAYLASFVARGIHVPSSVVRDVFDYLRSELDRLRRQDEPNCRGPDLRRYSSYYVLVQALLYIFCFRWQDLESSSDDDFEDVNSTSAYGHEHQWKYGVKEALSSNVFSKFNPLKVCSPAIVTEFARVANHLGAVYVYHLLETNKRVRLLQFVGNKYGGVTRETALSARRDEDYQHLDEYFPFDPYHLPKSKHWIEGDYREWAGIPGLDDEQDSESGSEEDDAVDSEVEEGTETDETGGFF